jgi:hypothetical protein
MQVSVEGRRHVRHCSYKTFLAARAREGRCARRNGWRWPCCSLTLAFHWEGEVYLWVQPPGLRVSTILAGSHTTCSKQHRQAEESLALAGKSGAGGEALRCSQMLRWAQTCVGGVGQCGRRQRGGVMHRGTQAADSASLHRAAAPLSPGWWPPPGCRPWARRPGRPWGPRRWQTPSGRARTCSTADQAVRTGGGTSLWVNAGVATGAPPRLGTARQGEWRPATGQREKTGAAGRRPRLTAQACRRWRRWSPCCRAPP